MNPRRLFPLLALLAAGPASAGDKPATAADVAAAERRFAAMAEAQGLGPAFTTFSAPDAVIFTPRPASAKKVYADPRHRFGTARLAWWPVYAGIARSGELGFSTGPFDFDSGKAGGWYFTVWRREADGQWRWLIDHGAATDAAPAYGPDAPLQSAPMGSPARRPAQGWSEVLAAEARLAAALAADAPKALARALWDDGRLMRQGPQPAVGRTAFAAAARAGPASIRAARLGGGISAAGDLAWTYGRAGWEEKGRAVEGHYVRIWQRRAGGWKLLVDEMIPMPPPPPPGRPEAAANPDGG